MSSTAAQSSAKIFDVRKVPDDIILKIDTIGKVGRRSNVESNKYQNLMRFEGAKLYDIQPNGCFLNCDSYPDAQEIARHFPHSCVVYDKDSEGGKWAVATDALTYDAFVPIWEEIHSEAGTFDL